MSELNNLKYELELDSEELEFLKQDLKQPQESDSEFIPSKKRTQVQAFGRYDSMTGEQGGKKSEISEKSSKSKVQKMGTRRLQQMVESNRKSIKGNETCSICIDEIDPKVESTLDGCKHKFCFECISNWATKTENTCPNCKKQFTKISYKTVGGDLKFLKVENKKNQIGHHLECDFCLETIRENIEYDICAICDTNASHQRCLQRNRNGFEFNRHYHCGQCQNMDASCPECDHESEEDDDSFIVDESYIDSFQVQQIMAMEQIMQRTQQLRSQQNQIRQEALRQQRIAENNRQLSQNRVLLNPFSRPPLREEFEITHTIRSRGSIDALCNSIKNLLLEKFDRIDQSSTIAFKAEIKLQEERQVPSVIQQTIQQAFTGRGQRRNPPQQGRRGRSRGRGRGRGYQR